MPNIPWTEPPLKGLLFAILLFGAYLILNATGTLKTQGLEVQNKRVGVRLGLILMVVSIGLYGFLFTTVAQAIGVQPTPKAEPQSVRWGPVDERDAGICITDCAVHSQFIAWLTLKAEVEQKLLSNVAQVPPGSIVRVNDFNGRKNWLVEIVAPDGKVIRNVWFGPDPLKDWKFDGQIRVGYVRADGPWVWGTFQRYSDGSYLKQ